MNHLQQEFTMSLFLTDDERSAIRAKMDDPAFAAIDRLAREMARLLRE